MNDRLFDFSNDDPERMAESQPEDLFQAVQALPCWNRRALAITELAIFGWASIALTQSREREKLAEIHGLIQRLQVIHPIENQPPELEVATRYLRWDGMAQLLEVRAHSLDYHQPEEVEKRSHMSKLKDALAAANSTQGVRTQELLEGLKLSKARLSQLLALAEAAGLIERVKQGQELRVFAAGIWRK